MIWPNVAAPCTSSDKPGAAGSLAITERLGEVTASSTRATLERWARLRASAIAVMVVPTLRAAPITQIRRPPSPAAFSSRPSRSNVSIRALTPARAWLTARATGIAPAARWDTDASIEARSPMPSPACIGTARRSALLMMIADESTNGKRCHQDGRQLLRPRRRGRYCGGRDDSRVGRGRAEAVACGCLAELGEIRFEQIALRLGIALERAQLHILLVGRGRLALERIERQAQLINLAAGKLGVVFQRARQPVGFATHLALEIRDLCAQLLDAGMLVQQRRGLLRQLRPQSHLLLR